jgi:hypothetical protein
VLHIALHFLIPALLVGLSARKQWLPKQSFGGQLGWQRFRDKEFREEGLREKGLRKEWQLAYFILVATMLVDIDHLLANPIYDPTRCSIGFHPLHQLWFIGLYTLLCFIPKTRLIGLGLTIHMALDSIDCQVTNGIWIN